MTDPTAYNDRPITPAVRSSVLIPFTQVLVGPMSMSLYNGIYEHFRSCNDHLVNRIFPWLLQFVFSVADIDDVPEHAIPDQKRVQEELDLVVGIMAKGKDEFEQRYRNLLQENQARGPANWNFRVFLMLFFQDSISA